MTVRAGCITTLGAPRRTAITRQVALAVCVTSRANAQFSHPGALNTGGAAGLNRAASR